MQFLIFGSREFAPTVAELVTDCGHSVAGFIDDFAKGPGILGSLEEVVQSHPACDFRIAMAVGYSDLIARWDAWKRVCGASYVAPPLVHPRAYVAKSATIGAGAMVMAGAIVDVRAQVGDAAVIWPGACINHDTMIGDNSFISPNATVCGFVELGAHCFVGAGSAIVDHCKVPDCTRIRMLSRYVGAST